RLWRECDIVISSERGDPRIRRRVDASRHTFYTSERWWKPPAGRARLLNPALLKTYLGFRRLSASPFYHLMPIGVHAARDLSSPGGPGGQWLWGYFTESCGTTTGRNEAGPVSILSAGRLLVLKRPIDILRAFERLSSEGIDARLAFVGDGPELERLRARAATISFPGSVSFSPSLPMREVWATMADSDIFVQASDGREGWGAVINEAMSCGCAIAASRQSGAAATMLRHGENALLHNAGNWQGLADNLRALCTDAALRRRLAAASRNDVENLWSPKIAAERLFELSTALVTGGTLPEYLSGPLSRPGVRTGLTPA
ncbi:MAG TPA: glycosyltransferase family 4 protein, partial [Opitutales bacterium]|nr:glycosyltransferase family 4 protein [Opitutales bacterium]